MNTSTHLPLDGITVINPQRRLDPARVADLADSLSRVGLLQPLVVTVSHRLVAGRHRLEAARSLGWATVPVVVVDLSELEVSLATLDENLVRNDLCRLERFEHLVQRAELVAALGQRRRAGRPRKADTVTGNRKTTDEVAAASGLSGRTLQRAVKIVAAIPQDVREKLRATPLADSTTELLRLSRLAIADQRAVAEQVVAGTRGAVNDLFLAAKRKKRAEDAARQSPRPQDDSEGVLVGEFEKFGHLIPDGEAALFVLDPPYADIDMYGRLGRLAEAKLRPGGFLVAYHSVHLLTQVVQELGQSLTYYWTLAIQCAGVHKQINGFRVRNGWKPVLVFQKPPRSLPPDWFSDFHLGGGNVKTDHDWQQPVSEARYVIERFTNPGDLIVDPTCGSGSALVAAKLAGRRWIGIDADESAAQIARTRLAQATGQ